jgi:ubiquinone/menaquinone biosynthesis C-methylase UbiE
MQPEQYQDFYALEDKHWWFAGMRNIFSATIAKIYGKNIPLKILDVGCGTGRMIKELEKYGRVAGVDCEEAALGFCRKREIKSICLANALRLPFRSGEFDLVTAFNLVEHVQDDGFLIKELSRVCKKGGRIILATSAFRFLWSKHDELNGHKRRYSKENLRELVKSQDLVIEKLTYTNFILFPFIWLGIILQSLFKPCFSSLLRNYYSIREPGNKILLLALRLEAWVLGRFNAPFGVSFLCVARKTGKD